MLLDQGKIGHLDVMVGSHESFVDENDRFVISSIIETRLTMIKTHIRYFTNESKLPATVTAEWSYSITTSGG